MERNIRKAARDNCPPEYRTAVEKMWDRANHLIGWIRVRERPAFQISIDNVQASCYRDLGTFNIWFNISVVVDDERLNTLHYGFAYRVEGDRPEIFDRLVIGAALRFFNHILDLRSKDEDTKLKESDFTADYSRLFEKW